MRGMIILSMLLIFCFSCEARAQSISTKIVRFEIGGKEVKKNYRVFFQSNGKWVETARTPTGFVVPAELTTEETLRILIVLGKHKLEFSSVHVSNFSEDWIVGIDKAPFSDEFVKPEEAKGVERVYYIQFLGKGLVRQLVVKEYKTR